jgi:hypothetical protein
MSVSVPITILSFRSQLNLFRRSSVATFALVIQVNIRYLTDSDIFLIIFFLFLFLPEFLLFLMVGTLTL